MVEHTCQIFTSLIAELVILGLIIILNHVRNSNFSNDCWAAFCVPFR